MKDGTLTDEMLRNLFRVLLAGLLMTAGVGLLFYVNYTIERSSGKPATTKSNERMLALQPACHAPALPQGCHSLSTISV
ncbi:hypothetical protein Q4485_13360 [Granulosicoccaceae sp. 1_MG-2023]|nr:hypothetical protein [Granulosicoccaceae sp. 1_MG-2023]